VFAGKGPGARSDHAVLSIDFTHTAPLSDNRSPDSFLDHGKLSEDRDAKGRFACRALLRLESLTYFAYAQSCMHLGRDRSPARRPRDLDAYRLRHRIR
jgi:hypothetical protein